VQLPTEAEIAERAERDGIDRRQAAKVLLDERQQPPQAPQPQGIVLCQATSALADGRLEITATFYPATGEPREQEQGTAPQ
jgi:hypothetical protein